MIKQFVPEEVCLQCKGCCRFREENSVWTPCLLDEEVERFIDNKDIPAVSISLDKRICAVPKPGGEGYVCPFLRLDDNKCKIYSVRPFECQLYPFLVSLRGKKVLLTVDLNCPYVQEKLKSEELERYTKYLAEFFNAPAQRMMLKDNPQLAQAYEEVLDVIELKNIDETA